MTGIWEVIQTALIVAGVFATAVGWRWVSDRWEERTLARRHREWLARVDQMEQERQVKESSTVRRVQRIYDWSREDIR